MNYLESTNWDEVIRTELRKPNPDIEGLFIGPDGSYRLDRRMTMSAIEKNKLTPRTADLNLVGPDILPVPDYLVEELTGCRNKNEQ